MARIRLAGAKLNYAHEVRLATQMALDWLREWGGSATGYVRRQE